MIEKHILKAFMPLINNFLPVLDKNIIAYKRKNLDTKLSQGEDVGILLIEDKEKIYIIFPVVKNNKIIKLMEVEGQKKILLTDFIENIVKIIKNGH